MADGESVNPAEDAGWEFGVQHADGTISRCVSRAEADRLAAGKGGEVVTRRIWTLQPENVLISGHPRAQGADDVVPLDPEGESVVA